MIEMAKLLEKWAPLSCKSAIDHFRHKKLIKGIREKETVIIQDKVLNVVGSMVGSRTKTFYVYGIFDPHIKYNSLKVQFFSRNFRQTHVASPKSIEFN